MKKIIGIVAAIAMITSAFAVDAAAKVYITGELFNYNASTKEIKALQVNHGCDEDNPNLSFSVSADRAGASFLMYDNVTSRYNIWFVPIVDILKINVGYFDINLNQETLGWSSVTAFSGYGYAATVTPIAGLSFDAFLAPGWGADWLKLDLSDGVAKENRATVKEFYTKVAYSLGDIGTIGAFYKFDAKKAGKIGVGFSGNFEPVSMFLNVIGSYSNTYSIAAGSKFKDGDDDEVTLDATGVTWAESLYGTKWTALDNLRFELFGDANLSGLNVKGFIALDLDMIDWAKKINDNLKEMGANTTVKVTYNKNTKLRLDFKAAYTLENGVTPYLRITDANVLNDSFAMNVTPGVTGNLGGMDWEVSVSCDLNVVNKKFEPTISIPVSFAVSF